MWKPRDSYLVCYPMYKRRTCFKKPTANVSFPSKSCAIHKLLQEQFKTICSFVVTYKCLNNIYIWVYTMVPICYFWTSSVQHNENWLFSKIVPTGVTWSLDPTGRLSAQGKKKLDDPDVFASLHMSSHAVVTTSAYNEVVSEDKLRR
jgi:hypothetical protein